MSITKSIDKSPSTKAGLKATLNYILQPSKTEASLCFVTGDYLETKITAQKVFDHFWGTKEIWNKTSKRQCKHFVISWHKDSPITHEDALDICRSWAENIFPDFSCAIAVHKDREYIHGHIVVNSVSFIDGHKYHMSKKEFQAAKDYCDALNAERGYSIVEKGKHYDESEIVEGTIRSYNKNDYKALNDFSSSNEKRFLAALILESLGTCSNKEELFSFMYKHGFDTCWEDTRKYITFKSHATGKTYRDKNIAKTFTLDISKEVYNDAFDRNTGIQEEFSVIADTKEKGFHELEEEIRGERGYEYAVSFREFNSGTIKHTSDRTERDITETDNFIKRITRKINELIIKRSRHSSGIDEGIEAAGRTTESSVLNFKALWIKLTNRKQIDLDNTNTDLLIPAYQLEEIRFHLIKLYYELGKYDPNSKEESTVWLYTNTIRWIHENLEKYVEILNSIELENLLNVLELRSRYTKRYESSMYEKLSNENWRDGINQPLLAEAYESTKNALMQPLVEMSHLEKLQPELAENVATETAYRHLHR